MMVEEWTKGKPFLLSLLAPWLATYAGEIHLVFEQQKEWRIQNYTLPSPKLPCWYRLYQSHDATANVLKKIFSLAYGERITRYGFSIVKFFTNRAFRKRKKPVRVTPKRIEFFKRFKESALAYSFKRLEQQLKGFPIDAKVKEILLNEVQNNIEFAFFIKVTAPCWILYGMSPTILYRKARQGNYSYIDKLLRIDPLICSEPYIRDAIAKYHFRNRSGEYNNLLKAPHRSPNVGVSRYDLKISIAGLISSLAYVLKYRLTAPEIKWLYDLIAQDCAPADLTKEKLQDPDIDNKILQDSDFDDLEINSFYKAIYRSRKFWVLMLTTRTKKNLPVSG